VPSACGDPEVPPAEAVRVPVEEVPSAPEAPVDPDDSVPDEVVAVDESPPDSELDESPFSDELELEPETLGSPVEVPLGSDDGQPPEVSPDSPVGKEEPPLDPDEPPLEPEDPPPELPPESPEPLEPEDPPPELPPLWDGDDCPPLVAQPATSITASASVGILNLIANSSRLLRGGEIIAPQE